ncbi:MAG: PD40 domain-containing protein, partial [Calditrichaceae bacterium]
MHIKPFFIGYIICLILCCGISSSAYAYFFGRNKVQYTDFDWQVMETEHFDIYFYPEMKDIAEKGALFAEEAYVHHETKFNYSINRRIPLIFYSSHLHFEQTNVTPGFIPEGVGGFFEFIKGRVVIPGNGDLKQFRRVIRHELVHVFMHGKINNIYSRHNQLDGVYPPLWYVEGIAEFWSGEWDAKGEMVLKDAVLNNYVVGLEDMYSILGTFTMYKVGQDIMHYITENYGEDKILALLEKLWKHKKFEDVFREVIGYNYKEFDKHYLHDLKKRYYPLMADQEYSDLTSETIVRDGYNFKPAFYQENDKDYLVFLGNRTGYSSIFIKPAKALKPDDRDETETLIKGEASSDYESFHLMDSKIDVNTNGLIAFSSKSGETDALYIYNIPERKVTEKKYFDHIVGISSPAWSPDGKKIVFSGLSIAGYNDLYIYDSEAETLIRLTDDFYNDLDPVFSPDGEAIAFSSDRTSSGEKGFTNLFLLDLNSRNILYLTHGNHNDIAPAFSPEGDFLAYTSDRTGTYNIYVIREPVKTVMENKPVTVRQMTNYIGTTFDPEWGADGSIY